MSDRECIMFQGILQYIYPSSCVLCAAATNQQAICPDCSAELVLNIRACSRCALPVSIQQPDALCGDCLQQSPANDRAWSPFLYAQPLEWMIQQLKFSSRLSFATTLAQLAIPYLPQIKHKPDCIIPVPLHPKRLRSRGFNQALALALPIARALQVPVDTHSCRRLIHTSAQSGLDAKQRRKNIRHAFAFDNARAYEYVVLFDDVITTGSTMTELAKLLKREGVQRVDVWSLARAEKFA